MPGHLRVTMDSANVAPAATLLSRSLASDCNKSNVNNGYCFQLTLQLGRIVGYIKLERQEEEYASTQYWSGVIFEECVSRRMLGAI